MSSTREADEKGIDELLCEIREIEETMCVYPPPPCPDNRAMSTRVLSKTLKWKLGSLSSPVATPR